MLKAILGILNFCQRPFHRGSDFIYLPAWWGGILHHISICNASGRPVEKILPRVSYYSDLKDLG